MTTKSLRADRYQFSLANGANWMALELGVNYTNLGATQTCAPGVACSIGASWGFEEGVLFGFPVTTVLALLPNLGNIFPALPPLPNGVTATGSHPYIGAFLHQDDDSAAVGAARGQAWQLTPAVGVGMINQWTNGLVVDTRVEYEFANSSFSFGPAGGLAANKGATVLGHVIFKY